jgi:hypothetical protein
VFFVDFLKVSIFRIANYYKTPLLIDYKRHYKLRLFNRALHTIRFSYEILDLHSLYLKICAVVVAIKNLRKKRPIFKYGSPDYGGLWLFDNATNHNPYSSDALVAYR